jgi:sigma-B regulation protein RsbU (phosphoserine phosphatase)
MFAAITRSFVRALAKQSQQPAELLGRLNELLYDELSAVGMFVTAQLVYIDLSRRELIAASAGHCPVLLMSTGPDPVQALRTTGTPLGILPNTLYRQQTVPFAEPGGLFLYTDGLTEGLNPAGEMFGQDRLIDWLRDHCQLPGGTDQLRDELAAELGDFRSGAALRDDQAFLILAEAPAMAKFPSRRFRATDDLNLTASELPKARLAPALLAI